MIYPMTERQRGELDLISGLLWGLNDSVSPMADDNVYRKELSEASNLIVDAATIVQEIKERYDKAAAEQYRNGE
jgi:hypothetical protein